jgi:hypothetical protein
LILINYFYNQPDEAPIMPQRIIIMVHPTKNCAKMAQAVICVRLR